MRRPFRGRRSRFGGRICNGRLAGSGCGRVGLLRPTGAKWRERSRMPVGYVSQAGVGRNGCACRGSGRYCRCSREGPECTVLFVAVSLAFGSAHSVRCCSHAAWACAVRVSCPGDDAVDSAGKIREGVPRAVPPSLSVRRPVCVTPAFPRRGLCRTWAFRYTP